MNHLAKKEEPGAVRNACKLCAPLGACLVFKGIRAAVPLLHGSQGCSTYIRRYLISHFKEPIDIACTNFSEETAIFGGGANLKTALDNIALQYEPELVGVATTCLSETIGDDVPMFIREYKRKSPDSAAIVNVSTPSYQGTHMQGFHEAVKALVTALAGRDQGHPGQINLFPGMVSPEDLRYLKEILAAFEAPCMVLPDISQTLDGPLWKEYQRIPEGGTRVGDIRAAGRARATLEMGATLGAEEETAGTWLERTLGVPCFRLGMPMGIRATDRFFEALKAVTGRPVPEMYLQERGRLTDSYVDGHKYVMDLRAVVYGEEDLVVGLAGFLGEIGVIPVLCASGGRSGHFREKIAEILPDHGKKGVHILEDADYTDIEAAAKDLNPDLFIGNSKGYAMARRMKIPLVRVGFPIHDRIGGPRLLTLGYRGAQQLFDRIVNTCLETRQETSDIGYSYM